MTTCVNHRYTPQMELLCKAIPCLRHLLGAVPWDPLLLAQQWGAASSGERAAIAFVISVWDSTSPDRIEAWAAEWGFPPFTPGDLSRLDADNQKAVAAWFAAPFWP